MRPNFDIDEDQNLIIFCIFCNGNYMHKLYNGNVTPKNSQFRKFNITSHENNNK